MPVIPIFPLEAVLLPGAPLPLHIFEPRYKEMIAECLEQHKHFGVVRAKEGSIAEIGCTAEILDVIKRYDDGRMDIATAGRQRFEIVELVSGRSFMQAEVTLVDDQPAVVTQDEVRRAVELHSQVLDLAGAEAEIDEEDLDDPQLSYRLAGALPMDLDFKQTLLITRSEEERLSGLIQFYETIIPTLIRVRKAREKAGGNGHV